MQAQGYDELPMIEDGEDGEDVNYDAKLVDELLEEREKFKKQFLSLAGPTIFANLAEHIWTLNVIYIIAKVNAKCPKEAQSMIEHNINLHLGSWVCFFTEEGFEASVAGGQMVVREGYMQKFTSLAKGTVYEPHVCDIWQQKIEEFKRESETELSSRFWTEDDMINYHLSFWLSDLEGSGLNIPQHSENV